MLTQLRILFISLIGDLKHNEKGFVKKDLDKFEAISDIDGVVCKGVTLSSEANEDYFVGNYLVKKISNLKPTKFFNSFNTTNYELTVLAEQIDRSEYDVLYSRYDVASLKFYRFVKKYGNKLILEHNSFEYDELLLGINSRREKLKFSLKPGYFIYLFEGKIWPLFCEKYYGPKIRKKVLGGICVTKEIEQYQKAIFPNYRTKVVTNGIKYDQSLLHKPILFDGKSLHLFMLLGTGAPWHGVDRLIEGLRLYKGEIHFKISIIGSFNPSDVDLVNKYGLNKSFAFHPMLKGTALNQVIETAHISIGTLAVHRKQLREASPLKVRDSLMRGYPNVIAYYDTDISDYGPLKDYVLQLPPDESPINFDKIVEFARKVLSIKDYSQKISEIARPRMEYKYKAKETVDFINSLIGANN